jgi:predicted ATP-grasp superfamily ATP-dependent carboligase
MPGMASCGAVVIGGYINGLGLVRSLGARGVPVALVETQPYDIARYSRFVATHERALDMDGRPEALAEILERRRRDLKGWVLLPSTDEALAAVTHLRDQLSPHHPIAAPGPEAVGYLLDKRRMREAAAAAGLALPAYHGPASVALLDRVGSHGVNQPLVFPVVVKPTAGSRFAARFDCKLFVARDARELAACIARVTDAGIPCDVHDLIPGGDDQIYAHTTYVDRRGRPTVGLTIRKLRQSPAGFGVARVAELVPDPGGLHEATVELARHIGLSGIAEAEWKRDARDGSLRFIEINGRSVIFNGLLRKGGLDLAALAHGEAVAGEIPEPRLSGWTGVWINLHADVLHGLLGHEEAAGWRARLGPYYLRPICEAVWSARDPAPFFAQWGRSARAVLASRGKVLWQAR